ncbi:SAM-dependent methyltransferase [Nakamurella sp. UYEF19]|uniref:class I SAM-dependent methyltransferase n=1 Tax=Nakamurella sp. UYEF19 TaxID=1756392 RepID=UPI00339A1BD0
MQPDFGGTTAQLYAKYRRDLPALQAAALAQEIGLRPDDIVIDLGCGTGQLAVPLQPYCAAVIGTDPEPAMLTELSARSCPAPAQSKAGSVGLVGTSSRAEQKSSKRLR